MTTGRAATAARSRGGNDTREPGRTRSRGREGERATGTTTERRGGGRETGRQPGDEQEGEQAKERRKTAEEGTTTPPGGPPGVGAEAKLPAWTIHPVKLMIKNHMPETTGERRGDGGGGNDSREKEAPGSYLPRARRALQHSVQRVGISSYSDGQLVDFSFPRISWPSPLTGAVSP